jgi:hypothetical protein
MSRWKKYILVRWKERWPIIPAAGIVGVFATLVHRGTPVANALFFASFAAVVILFPFHWGGETWRED